MWPVRSFVRAVLSASLLSTLPLTLGVLGERSIAIAGGNVLQELTSVTDEMLKQPDPGDWLMRRGDYRAWGYSALDQIQASLVGGDSTGRIQRATRDSKFNLPGRPHQHQRHRQLSWH
jgi:hypothetical protein